MIIQPHLTLLTDDAYAIDLRCQYPIGDRPPLTIIAGGSDAYSQYHNYDNSGGTARINPRSSVLIENEVPTAKAVYATGPEPVCTLRVTTEDENAASVDSANVGDVLKLALSIEPAASYALMPRNCYAINVANGERHLLTDATGCAVDARIFPEWRQVRPHLAEAHFHTFRWPDASMVRFECDCSACLRNCPQVGAHFQCCEPSDSS